jgi:hypothetical protein
MVPNQSVFFALFKLPSDGKAFKLKKIATTDFETNVCRQNIIGTVRFHSQSQLASATEKIN